MKRLPSRAGFRGQACVEKASTQQAGLRQAGLRRGRHAGMATIIDGSLLVGRLPARRNSNWQRGYLTSSMVAFLLLASEPAYWSWHIGAIYRPDRRSLQAPHVRDAARKRGQSTSTDSR